MCIPSKAIVSIGGGGNVCAATGYTITQMPDDEHPRPTVDLLAFRMLAGLRRRGMNRGSAHLYICVERPEEAISIPLPI